MRTRLPIVAGGRARRIVVFDLGGVLIDWDPRHLYRTLIPDPAAMERFLATVCTPAWNERQDAGRPIAEAVATLAAEHPADAGLIAAFYDRWPEMLGGAHADAVQVLADLRARATPLYALTNWSAETFPHARRAFAFLGWFAGIVVSGEVGLKKPDPRIFEVLFRTHGFAATDAVFIDDSAANVATARALGLYAIRFEGAAALRRELGRLGLL